MRRILKEEGIEPGPDRTSDSWTEFISRHKETLWAVDIFSVRAVTSRGLRQLNVMAFLHLETREAIVTESTEHPDSVWVCEQTDWFLDQTKGREKRPEVIIHDRDLKFTKQFTRTLAKRGAKTNPLPVASPGSPLKNK